MSSRSRDRWAYLVRTSVLSRVAVLTSWPVRWSRWDTTSACCAWALGRSARPTSGSDGGLFAGGPTRERSVWATSLCSNSTQSGGGACINRGKTQTDHAREAEWATCLGAGGGSTSRGGQRKDELLQSGQVRESEWATNCANSGATRRQVGAEHREELQPAQLRAASAGPIPGGASAMPTASSAPSRRRSTTGSRPGSSPGPGPSPPAGAAP